MEAPPRSGHVVLPTQLISTATAQLAGLRGHGNIRKAHVPSTGRAHPCWQPAGYASIVPHRQRRPLHFAMWQADEVNTSGTPHRRDPVTTQHGDTRRRPRLRSIVGCERAESVILDGLLHLFLPRQARGHPHTLAVTRVAQRHVVPRQPRLRRLTSRRVHQHVQAHTTRLVLRSRRPWRGAARGGRGRRLRSH